MLWARRDGALVHAEAVASGLGPADPHPRGFVCASAACTAGLTFYREHPQAQTVIPPHFQLASPGPGRSARHDEGCEVEDGSWMTPEGEQPPAAPRPRPLRLADRLHRLALRRSPEPGMAAAEPLAAGGGSPRVLSAAPERARRLTSASAVGRRHLEVREDDEGAALLFSGREVLWRNFVYEPHRYGELVERFRFFGNPPHRIALVVRPVEVGRREDGYWRLTCAPLWLRPTDDIAVPMIFTQTPELFEDLDAGRLYVALVEVTIRQWERDHGSGDGPFQATYVFGTIADAADFGGSESAEDYAGFLLGPREAAA